jgi:hypothetical protein
MKLREGRMANDEWRMVRTTPEQQPFAIGHSPFAHG